MHRITRITAVAFAFGLGVAASAAVAQTAMPAKTGQTPAGPVLTDSKGMTLYVFDRDSGGKSACNGQCATNWPPLAASADAKPSGDYSVVTRDDGTRQWAYKGKPLYTWSKDSKVGDTTGEGVNNVWHVARP
ncbi:COG4315 family predicted lipoprotein [Azospirillum sp. sgz302134]